MTQYLDIVLALASFAIIALASQRIGHFFADIKLPMISGFLLIGIIAGPYLLRLVSQEAVARLVFLDDISLAVIAFAAGSELYLKELRNRFKSIAWVTLANSIIIPIVGVVSLLMLADQIPFMQDLSDSGRFGVALLAGAILVARSPSSAIAIVNELRARGPFTRGVLGVTMVSDVVIIILFAIAMSVAHVLFNGGSLELNFILLLAAELAASFAIGYGIGRLLDFVLSQHLGKVVKSIIILVIGYGVFVFAHWVTDYSHENLPIEFALEPLLICMIGSFVVTNFGNNRAEFLQLIHDIGPPIYVIFFTLTGASLQMDVFIQLWPIALALFVIRIAALFVASFAGGTIAGDPMQHNVLSWMTYVTQAGVALGLAKNVADEFPEWGPAFATMIISTVVISQLAGPPFFKWAIQRVKEAHLQAPGQEFDGVRDAVIIGLEGQSLALARLLAANGWNAKIATRQADKVEEYGAIEIPIEVIPDLSKESLESLDLGRADALITMMTNDENYQVCELVYEHFGIQRMIARLAQPENGDRFAKLDVIVLEPTTAMVSLLDHFVRAPAATSLLLDRAPNQRVLDIQITNPNIHGLTIRDLRVPLDVLIVSVTRNDSILVSHGYTQLALGDWVSVLGTPEGVEELALRLEV